LQQTSKIDELLEQDRMIDAMLDPLGQELFPSLGFEHEARGAYFIQVTNGDKMVSAWRIVNGAGLADRYTCHVYHRKVFNGVTSWGNPLDDQYDCEDLIQVQAIMHEVFGTSGGNNDMGG
jgi:hypothetical protein